MAHAESCPQNPQWHPVMPHITDPELAPTGDSAEARWIAPEKALEEVSNKVMKDRLQVLLHFDGTINYRSYTLKPYQVLLEQGLGES